MLLEQRNRKIPLNPKEISSWTPTEKPWLHLAFTPSDQPRARLHRHRVPRPNYLNLRRNQLSTHSISAGCLNSGWGARRMSIGG